MMMPINMLKQLEKKPRLVFIHTFDDVEVMAGETTIAKELLEQLPSMDKVFIPIGGGGLTSSMATYIKHCAPNIKVISVEPEDSPTLYQALKNNHVVLKDVGCFADGRGN